MGVPVTEASLYGLKGTVETLLKPENKAQLVKILTYHVVAANAMSDAVGKMIKDDGGKHTIKTVSGGVLIATMKNGKIELQDEKGQLPFKVGDQLELYVTQVRGTNIYLSNKATSKNLADDLEDAFDMMLPIEGRVAEVVNGGFRVSIKGKVTEKKFLLSGKEHTEYVGETSTGSWSTPAARASTVSSTTRRWPPS